MTEARWRSEPVSLLDSVLSRRAVLLTGLAGLGARAVSACGDDSEVPSDDMLSDEAGSGTVSVAPDGTQEITLLVRDDYDFRPAGLSATTGRVRLSLTSEADELTRNFRFTPRAGPTAIGEDTCRDTGWQRHGRVRRRAAG